MKIEGRRHSDNIVDRRGVSGKTVGIGGGIIGVIIAGIIALLSGGDVNDVINQAGAFNSDTSAYVEDEQDKHLAELVSVVLASTEDVWTSEFQRMGWGKYRAPHLVLFNGSTNSGCGHATRQIGPFYCSADETVYLDLDFFKTMQKNIGASGDFAYAYVIAHEVGHHVQHLLGTLSQAHNLMNRVSEKEANQISVRLELQADFYAGVWANIEGKTFKSLERDDIENAIKAASKIGDDYLQKQAYGYEMPDSFNHGRSSQRVKWLTNGIKTGDPRRGDTFSPPYNSL